MFRNYWDIWMPANVLVTLQFDEAQRKPPMELKEVDAMLDWLDSGARPRDDVVLNHTIYHLVEFTSGVDTRRLLRIFNALPQRNQNWWILQPLARSGRVADFALLAHAACPKRPAAGARSPDRAPGKTSSREMPKYLRRAARPPKNVCCSSCARERQRLAASPDTQIHSEEEARKWLAEGSAPATFNIRYSDDLKRSAIVRRADGSEQTWQYLYDCWRRTDKPADTAAH